MTPAETIPAFFFVAFIIAFGVALLWGVDGRDDDDDYTF